MRGNDTSSFEEFEPVEVGHEQVGQNDVRVEGLEAAERGDARRGVVGLVAFAADAVGKNLSRIPVVVDNEDPRTRVWRKVGADFARIGARGRHSGVLPAIS